MFYIGEDTMGKRLLRVQNNYNKKYNENVNIYLSPELDSFKIIVDKKVYIDQGMAAFVSFKDFLKYMTHTFNLRYEVFEHNDVYIVLISGAGEPAWSSPCLSLAP
jgi:hypothetical protein